MIEYLRGILLRKKNSGIILDCNGVGYGLDIPLSKFDTLPAIGQECSFYVYTKVKEDALSLYGFQSFEERQVFEVLLQVNGIGPKVAMGILSTMTIEELKLAILEKKPETLQMVPGVGLRTAQKIGLELSNKLDRFPSLPLKLKDKDTSLKSDLLSALLNLGFKEKLASDAIEQSFKREESREFSDLVRSALYVLRQQSLKDLNV